MSIRASNWAWDQGLEPRSKLVLMSLADHADEDGICWPKINTLAKRTGQSRGTVKRKLSELVDAGLIVRFERKRPDGGRTSDEIRLQFDMTVTLAELEDEGEDEAPASETPGHSVTGGGVAAVTQAPVQGSDSPPESLRDRADEPSIEQPNQPAPQPPASGVRSGEPDGFREFWDAYPGRELMDRAKALRCFVGMTVDERKAAIAAVPRYAAALAKTGNARRAARPPKDAHRWLERQQWLEFPAPVSLSRVEENSEQHEAWKVYSILTRGFLSAPRWDDLLGVNMLTVATEWPPIGRGLSSDGKTWCFVEYDTKQFWAWNNRVAEYGRKVAAGTEHSTDAYLAGAPIVKTQPEIPVGKGKRSRILVPQEWPPSKGSQAPPESSAA